MFATLDTNGVPIVLSTKDQGGMTPIPPEVNGALSMLTAEGVWVPRPVINALFMADSALTFGDYPVGTTVEVVDVLDGVVLFDGILDGVIDLPDDGVYQIEVKPPAPWVGWFGKVTRP